MQSLLDSNARWEKMSGNAGSSGNKRKMNLEKNAGSSGYYRKKIKKVVPRDAPKWVWERDKLRFFQYDSRTISKATEGFGSKPVVVLLNVNGWMSLKISVVLKGWSMNVTQWQTRYLGLVLGRIAVSFIGQTNLIASHCELALSSGLWIGDIIVLEFVFLAGNLNRFLDEISSG